MPIDAITFSNPFQVDTIIARAQAKMKMTSETNKLVLQHLKKMIVSVDIDFFLALWIKLISVNSSILQQTKFPKFWRFPVLKIPGFKDFLF